MKKKYSVFNQYSYMYRHLWEYSPKLVLHTILEIITNSLLPLTSALLPAMIVGLLENQCDLKALCLVCLAAFGSVGLLHAAATFLKRKNHYMHIFYRVENPYLISLKKSITLDYVLYEQEDVQTKMENAGDALSGNHVGIEGFYHYNVALFTNILGLIIYSIVLANCNPLIVLCLLAISVIQYAFYSVAKNYENKHKDEQATRERHRHYLFSQAYDVKSGKDIRLYQLQDWLTRVYEKYDKEYQKQASKTQSLYYLYDLVGLALQFFRDGICYAYLIYLLLQGMSVSEFVLYLGVVRGFGSWFSQISEAISNVSRCLMGVERFREYEDLKDIYYHDTGKELSVKENESFDIVFEDVCFAYPNSDQMILDHISLHIHSKEKIALVGVNGAGKTTLVKMLCGFYRPTSGRILINGIDITELNIEKYFDQVSVLFQDSVLFSISIAENITGQPIDKIDQKRLSQALKLSGLSEKVNSLPKKELTYIGKDIEEDGIQLSGGQIQKLFLARALYKNAPMIILDEPTAALDAIAENEMYQQYAQLVENKTSIFISHRLSSTRFCDRILFLEDGKIKESGTHEELMNLEGSYANMFNIQSQYYAEGDESNEIQ